MKKKKLKKGKAKTFVHKNGGWLSFVKLDDCRYWALFAAHCLTDMDPKGAAQEADNMLKEMKKRFG